MGPVSMPATSRGHAPLSSVCDIISRPSKRNIIAPKEPAASVKTRVASLLRKLPQGEEDWHSKVPTAARLRELHGMLSLQGVTAETSVPELFDKYSQKIARYRDAGAEAVVDFMKILAIATGKVLLAAQGSQQPHNAEYRAVQRAVCDGMRQCFRAARSVSRLENDTLIEYMSAISRGVELMDGLEIFFTPRAHELPLHVGMFSIILSCRSQDSVPYIIHNFLHSAYPPNTIWNSRGISFPYIIHNNLGKRFSPEHFYDLLGISREGWVERVTVDPSFLS